MEVDYLPRPPLPLAPLRLERSRGSARLHGVHGAVVFRGRGGRRLVPSVLQRHRRQTVAGEPHRGPLFRLAAAEVAPLLVIAALDEGPHGEAGQAGDGGVDQDARDVGRVRRVHLRAALNVPEADQVGAEGAEGGEQEEQRPSRPPLPVSLLLHLGDDARLVVEGQEDKQGHHDDHQAGGDDDWRKRFHLAILILTTNSHPAFPHTKWGKTFTNLNLNFTGANLII